ncbi:MAG: Gfo/Idh/MocA family protein [Thermomicrobiales bacterium]
MDPLRIGIIGCGIGIFHAASWAQEPRARIVALAGLEPDRCAKICRDHAIPSLHRDYRELIAQPEIDAVSIAVPNHLHLPVALAAFEAGKHVLLEKPIGLNAAEGERIVRAARDAGKVLGVFLSKRHAADMDVLRQHVQAGELGEIYYAKAFWMRRAGIPGHGAWFTRKETAGGGPMIDLGVHVLDMALFLMGNPKVVTVSASTYAKFGPRGKGFWAGRERQPRPDDGYDVEDLATAFLRTESGATIQLEASWAAYCAASDEYGISLMGDEGGAEIRVNDYVKTGTLRLFGDAADVAPRFQPQDEHLQIVTRFVDAILTGAPMSPGGEEGLERTRIIDAIYASAAQGRELRLDEARPGDSTR